MLSVCRLDIFGFGTKAQVDRAELVAARFGPVPGAGLGVAVVQADLNVRICVGCGQIRGDGCFTAATLAVDNQNIEVCHSDSKPKAFRSVV